YAHLVVGEAVDREVLPELAVDEVVAAEHLLPVAIRRELVDQHRAVLAAVPREVSLPVALDVQPPHETRPADGLLPHPGMHRGAAPGHVLGQAHVDRHQRRHANLSRPGYHEAPAQASHEATGDSPRPRRQRRRKIGADEWSINGRLMGYSPFAPTSHPPVASTRALRPP